MLLICVLKKQPNYTLSYEIINDVLKLKFFCKELISHHIFNINLVEKKINFKVYINELVKKSPDTDLKMLLTTIYEEINKELEIMMKIHDHLKDSNVNNTIKKLETSKNDVKKCMNTLTGHIDWVRRVC